MERDRIFRRRRENEKKEIEETIRRGVKIEIKKIMRKKASVEGKVNIGINGETEERRSREAN